MGRSATTLTRSARAERQRILGLYEKAVSETCQMMLMSGWNKLTPHQRRHAKAVAQAFEWAADALKRALEQTLPPEAACVPDELKARRGASGIETEGHDGATRHGAKHESPAPKGDAK